MVVLTAAVTEAAEGVLTVGASREPALGCLLHIYRKSSISTSRLL
jgi:hypothetical protein